MRRKRDRKYQRGEMAPRPCFLWVWTMLPLGMLTSSLVMWVRGTGWVRRAAPQCLFLWGFYTSWNMPKTKNCFYFLLYPICADSCACMLSQQSCPTLCNPTVDNPPSFSVHRILQARILEWVAMFSRRSSQASDGSHVSYWHLFTTSITWKPVLIATNNKKLLGCFGTSTWTITVPSHPSIEECEQGLHPCVPTH